MSADLDGTVWSELDASNNATPPNGWPEGQAPSSINDCARMMMGATKRAWDRDHGSSGSSYANSSNAYTINYTTGPTGYLQGQVFVLKAPAANTGASTANIGTIGGSAVGARNIFKKSSLGPTALTGGEIQPQDLVHLEFDGTQFQIISNTPGGITSLATGNGLTGGPITTSGTVSASASTGIAVSSAGIAIDASYVQGFIGGLQLSNDGTSPNTVIDIAAGVCVDSTASVLMKLAAFTKTTGSWAVGSGNGGLDTGSVANSTWYHVFVIERTDTGVVDALISTSATSPTLPTNYSKFRRIGSFKTDGSAHIVTFLQVADVFRWKTPPLDVSNGTNNAYTATALSVPPGVVVEGYGRVQGGNGSGGTATILGIRPPSLGDATPTQNATPLGLAPHTGIAGGSADQMTSVWRCLTNTSSQIEIHANNGQYYLTTEGWRDFRGAL